VIARLVERGHTVWYHTDAAHQLRVEQVGARFVATECTPDFQEFRSRDVLDAYLAAAEASGWTRRRSLPLRALRRLDRVLLRGRGMAPVHELASFNRALERRYVHPLTGQVHDYQTILERFPADVLLTDDVCLGAMALHEQGGPPWATLGVGPLLLSSPDTPPVNSGSPPPITAADRQRYRVLHWLSHHIGMYGVNLAWSRERAKLGLRPLAGDTAILRNLVSPFLHIQGSTASFEFPRRTPSGHIHFVGPFLDRSSTNAGEPGWWHEFDDGRPIVLVAQGTFAAHPDLLVLPTLRALATDDVHVLALTPDPESLGPLPENARAESFMPYEWLLPRVALLVKTGGYYSTQAALAHGVPLVSTGWSLNGREIASRIAWLGVGIDLGDKPPLPEQIGEAVRRVLSEARYRSNAQRLQLDIARHDGPTRAAELLERLAASRRPVT
jgi:UDP:flavonoid glycosyltransferase YjiC (YdhE family)